jgi:hypothetical protein
MTSDQIEEDEVVLFKAKPNPFLYTLEALRGPTLVLLSMTIALIPITHFKTTLAIAVVAPIVLITFSLLYLIALFLFPIGIFGVVFIVTDKRVLIRQTLFGSKIDLLSTSIKCIVGVEVRSYGARYGSVHFKLLKSLGYCGVSKGETSEQSRLALVRDSIGEASHVAEITTRLGWSAAWFSMPSLSQKDVIGFYGFKRCDAFAEAVVRQQQALSEACNGGT